MVTWNGIRYSSVLRSILVHSTFSWLAAENIFAGTDWWAGWLASRGYPPVVLVLFIYQIEEQISAVISLNRVQISRAVIAGPETSI